MRVVSRLYRRMTDIFRRSFRNKLILILTLLSVLPIIVITLLATENNRHSMETEVIHTNLSNMNWTGVFAGEQLAGLHNLVYSILISPPLNNYLFLGQANDLSSQYATYKQIIDTMSNAYYSAVKQVVGIELYIKERSRLFAVNSMEFKNQSQNVIPPKYADLFEQKKYFVLRTSPDDPKRFQFIRSINRFENREIIGGISLEVEWDLLDPTLSLLRPADDQAVMIVDATGQILYQIGTGILQQTDMDEILAAPAQSRYLRSKNEYVFYNRFEPWGITLIKIVPNRFINQSAQETRNAGVIVGSVTAIFAVLVAVLIAWGMSKPIVRLARSMDGFGLMKESEFRYSDRVDEIGLLETKLSFMSHRIREHVKTEYSMELEKKTAELKALQAQINPHFLHNTLQLIGSMLFSTNPKESYEILKALSDMFRYVIRESGELSTISKEIEHLNNYMRIQQKRYAANLRYSCEVDDDSLDCRIPKLTLQPIVENALVHGLEKKKGQWELNVRIARQESNIRIQIRDNGIGIPAERLAALRLQLEHQLGQVWNSGERIGLKNVASRIRMQFGAKYGVILESQEHEGTLVTIRLPYYVPGGESQDDPGIDRG